MALRAGRRKIMNIIPNRTGDIDQCNLTAEGAITVLKVNPDSIPADLKAHPYWAPFVLTPREKGKFNKIPVDPKTEIYLRTNSPEGWVSFDEAYTAYQANEKYAGIGILLTPEDHLIGVDIDDCMEAGSPAAEIAADIINTLSTYTEISPSGTGYRCIGKRGKKEVRLDGNKVDGVEFYVQGRFLTITGHTGDCHAK